MQIGGIYGNLLVRQLLSGDRNSLYAVQTDRGLEVLLRTTGDVIDSNRSIMVPVSNVWTDINERNDGVWTVADIGVLRAWSVVLMERCIAVGLGWSYFG
jgi:hypothetical protein